MHIISLLLLSGLIGILSSTASVQKKADNQPVLVGVVSRYEPSVMSMDAVVMVENGVLKTPFAEQDEVSSKNFANIYFKSGRKYRITFGGGEVGTATVQRFDFGCNNIHATVDPEGAPRIQGSIMGLATNSNTLGRKPSSRRAPTAGERSAVMALVKQIYSARKTGAAMLRRMTTTNLTATDLDGDGKLELVGSFVIQNPDKNRRDLFLIAELYSASARTGTDALSEGENFKAALIDYQSYRLEDFDSAIDFVDQLDLDSDGIAEVFARQQGFDAYGYLIYRKQNGRWRKVYNFIGDAC